MMPRKLSYGTAGRLTLAALASLGGGCGLISSDIASIRFDLPPRTYTFDTMQSGWNLPPANLPSVPCTDANVCCTAATAAGVPCANVICDAASGTCALTTTVETQPQVVDLSMSAPSSVQNQSVADITVSQIKYDVTRNTMNVALPPVELFVADQGVTSTSDPRAKRFGTVPSTPAGAMPTNANVTLDPAGQDAFKSFAHNLAVPFVFLSRSTVVVPGGTPIPSGAVDITVKGQISVKPSL